MSPLNHENKKRMTDDAIEKLLKSVRTENETEDSENDQDEIEDEDMEGESPSNV